MEISITPVHTSGLLVTQQPLALYTQPRRSATALRSLYYRIVNKSQCSRVLAQAQDRTGESLPYRCDAGRSLRLLGESGMSANEQLWAASARAAFGRDPEPRYPIAPPSVLSFSLARTIPLYGVFFVWSSHSGALSGRGTNLSSAFEGTPSRSTIIPTKTLIFAAIANQSRHRSFR